MKWKQSNLVWFAAVLIAILPKRRSDKEEDEE